jgi:hypothetical protein
MTKAAKAAVAAASDLPPSLQDYVLKRHPSGDRYIITAKSERAASPAMSGASNMTPRSVASTPAGRAGALTPVAVGRPNSRAGHREHYPAKRIGARIGARKGRGDDRRVEQDKQILEYHSSWKHIATSKTEKEADQMVMSAIQRSPMRRFLEEGDRQGMGSKFLSHTLEGLGQEQPQAPKVVTLQVKNRNKLERMKQVCRIFVHHIMLVLCGIALHCILKFIRIVPHHETWRDIMCVVHCV